MADLETKPQELGVIPHIDLKESELENEKLPDKTSCLKSKKAKFAIAGTSIALIVAGAVVAGLAGSGALIGDKSQSQGTDAGPPLVVIEEILVEEPATEVKQPLTAEYVRYEETPRNYFKIKDGPMYYADNDNYKVKANKEKYDSREFDDKYVHKNRGAEPIRSPLPKKNVVMVSPGDNAMEYQGVYYSNPSVDPADVAPQKEILMSLWNWEEWKATRGDGVCGRGEWYRNSPEDCPGFVDCGNGLCDEGESRETCPEDCVIKKDTCGDGVWADQSKGWNNDAYEILQENKRTCPIDVPDSEPMDICGDGVCGLSEGCFFCSQDCGECKPMCGDGKCSRDVESCDSCPRDCGKCDAVEGDGVCAFPFETPENSADCAPVYLNNQIIFEGVRYSTIDNADAAGYVDGGSKACESGKAVPRGWKIADWGGAGSRVDRLLQKSRFQATCLIFSDGSAHPSADNKPEWCTYVDLQINEDVVGVVIPKFTEDWYCPGHRVLIEVIADTLSLETREKKPCTKDCFGNGACNDYEGTCSCKGRWTGEACYRVIGDLSIPKSDNDWYKPDRFVTWQWHLDGEIDHSYDVDIYDVDIATSPQTIQKLHDEGRKVICYFSAGSWEEFRTDGAMLDKSIRGGPLIFGEGDVFLDEAWLDLRRMDMILETMLNRVERAKKIGCDGIEFDNPDVALHGINFPNDGGYVELTTNFWFNIWLVQQTHARGMAVALKNSDYMAAFFADDYDMVVNEECHVLQICDNYWPFLNRNKPVLNAEYLGARCFYCEQANRMGISTIKKEPALTACMVDCRTEWSDKICAGYGYPENKNFYPEKKVGWCPFMMNQDKAECPAPRYAEFCEGKLSY